MYPRIPAPPVYKIRNEKARVVGNTISMTLVSQLFISRFPSDPELCRSPLPIARRDEDRSEILKLGY